MKVADRIHFGTLFIMCVCVGVCVYYSQQPIEPQSYPVLHAVANPVRGLLDRKISEEQHLQSSNESMETETKQIETDKNKGTKTKAFARNDRRRARDSNHTSRGPNAVEHEDTY